MVAPQSELRDQDTFDSGQPTAPKQALDVGWATQVATGYAHTCAVTVNDGVKCWGDNTFGQLGDGTPRSRAVAVDVLGLGERVARVSAGALHTCAMLRNGGVKCWGRNNKGQLGDGTIIDRSTPVEVQDLVGGVRAVSSGRYHTCALLNNGAIKCWGSNQDGQLGDGTTLTRLTPVDAPRVGERGARVIRRRFSHLCYRQRGGLACWGNNERGQLGDGTTVNRLSPVDVVGLGSEALAVSAGGLHTCALTVGGGVKCWGYNGYGELGDGTTTGRLTPVAVVGLDTEATAISAGRVHTCVRTAGGGVKCWGDNDYGELGDGTTAWRLTPVAVSGLAANATEVSTSHFHTCAIVAGGTTWCWGWNDYGQLGDGTTITRRGPVAVWDTTYDCTAVTEIPASECRALVTFFKATNGPLWQDHTGWLRTATPCSWQGVDVRGRPRQPTCPAGQQPGGRAAGRTGRD